MYFQFYCVSVESFVCITILKWQLKYINYCWLELLGVMEGDKAAVNWASEKF